MKKYCFLLTIFSVCSALFALPGVVQHIPDVSGEYVFYRDKSFERESYIGFVYYDESTYGLRYYAPAAGTKKQPIAAKDIQLYVTVDATLSHLELTGEHIASEVTAEDTDVVNYLHDLLYEFTARRQKAGDIAATASLTQDFSQFGGDVTIDYNALVPLFNIQAIKALDGSVVFQVVTTGILSAGSSDAAAPDTSFTDFTGIPEKLQDKAHSFKPKKKAAKTTFTYTKDIGTEQAVTLDTHWTQYADNFFFLEKNAALLTFDALPPAEQDYTAQLTRSLIRNTRGSYTDWTKLSITKSGEHTLIRFPVYDKTSNICMQSFKLIDSLADGSVAFLILTVYDGAYTKNSAYFDALLASYSVKK